jgi:hypothetical protein
MKLISLLLIFLFTFKEGKFTQISNHNQIGEDDIENIPSTQKLNCKAGYECKNSETKICPDSLKYSFEEEGICMECPSGTLNFFLNLQDINVSIASPLLFLVKII